MASQLALKSRIASTASLAKIFNAQEMIASSHIAKARDVAFNAKPYSDAIFEAVCALAANSEIEHPITGMDRENNPRVAVLAITADRGMAGPYTSSIIRETEDLLKRLDHLGKEPQLYVYGRRGVSYYRYRNRQIAGTWEGESDHPSVGIARAISEEILRAYTKPVHEGGVNELYVVFTEYVNMVTQKVKVLRMLPVEVIRPNRASSGSSDDEDHRNTRDTYQALRQQSAKKAGARGAVNAEQDRLTFATAEIHDGKAPLFRFEPSLGALLDLILSQYIQSRVHECLLTSAASETASRQNAMHTATDNTNKLIEDLTRQLNASRQASITQELTEIISSANALNNQE